jgi:hypothetical protein
MTADCHQVNGSIHFLPRLLRPACFPTMLRPELRTPTAFMRPIIPLLALVTVSALSAATPVPRFRVVDVDTKIEIGYGVTVADVDGDKKPDILLADKNEIVWYQNPNWEKHVIADHLTPKDHVCIAAMDIDGDGKAEIAVGAEWNPGDTVNSGAVFYLIPPADRRQKWEPVKLTHEPTVHRMRWVRNAQGKFDLVVVPLHGRGNKNATGEGVHILAYKVPADVRQPWLTELLDGSLHVTHNFDPVQWDGDPQQELLVGGKEGSFVLKRGGGKSTLTKLGTEEGGGAGEIRLGRLPGGKRFFATVEPFHGTQAVAYTPPAGADGKAFWKRHVLDTTLLDGHAVACGDLTGVGSDQVVVGWRAMAKPGARVGIKLFTPLDAEGDTWQTTLVDDNTMACEDLCLADLNGDGRPDIIAAGRATKNVKIYFNEGAK